MTCSNSENSKKDQQNMLHEMLVPVHCNLLPLIIDVSLMMNLQNMVDGVAIVLLIALIIMFFNQQGQSQTFNRGC
jgi:hypothetical protein